MLTAQPIEAVLFDMDGVLVNVSGSYRRAVQETVRAFTGTVVTPQDVQAYKDRGGYNNDWKLSHDMIRAADVDASYAEVVRAFQQIYLGRRFEEGVFDGLIAEEPPLLDTAVLSNLAEHYLLAVVTGRPERDAAWTLARFGWTRFFPIVVGMDQQNGRGKPDPYGIDLAMAQLRTEHNVALPSHAALYIGDNGDDMRAARAAGLMAVGAVPPYLDFAAHRTTLMAAGADVVLSHAADVATLLQSLAGPAVTRLA